jgi:gliding motility-associated-like protein
MVMKSLQFPYGNYIVKITDACGRIAQDSLLIEFEPLQPSVRGRNNGCFSLFGRLTISIPQQELVSATILAAPAAYTQSLPQDVTNFINGEGILNIPDLPVGIYTVTFTDNCGFTYTVEAEIPPFVEKDFAISTLPDCTAWYGTVQMKSGNGNLTSVIITAAPAAFGQTLPFDVSANITAAEGDLFMNNLPAGIYTFKATDICGIEKSKTIDIIGYIPPQNSVAFFPNCGSFSVKVTDAGNGVDQATYWLQRFNPVTGAWGHPSPNNNNVYAEGTVPTTDNSIKLTNNIMRNNLNFTGNFRVIKKFEAYGNATAEKTICLSVIGEFTFTDAFALSNAYTLACTGSPNDVYIEAQGYNLTYRVEKKNGADFLIDNGSNNVFTDLEPAIYLFTIEDACGNKLTKEVNLRELPSIADATQPMDMHICVEQGSADTNTFHLTEQNAAILGDLPSAMYTITYHLTQEDADNGVNALPEYYTNTSNGQIIYARLVNNHITLCHGTTSFALYVGEYPQASITTTGTICNEGMLVLTASDGFDNYLWSTGETTRTIFVTQPGIYTVVVEKEYGNRVCDNVADVEIFASSTPSIVKIDTDDWTRDENSITVHAEGASGYEYSLDGINYQASNVFTGLVPGIYQVYVKDARGCGVDVKEIVLMNYPNFFTPNGDGYHDKWRVKYSAMEPNFHVTIFDRYGKVITDFGATSEGWDGTYNGTALPSTDYWFVVKREDGRELRGHFAMLR